MSFLNRAARISAAFALVFSAAAEPTRAEVPLTWDALGYVTVKAKVDGQGPFDFVLDTGADETGVYASFAQRVRLPAGKSADLTGGTGSAKVGTVKVGALDLDSQQWSDLTAVVLPDRPDGGANLAGVLGYDQMNGRLTVIDFACGRAAFLPLAADRDKQAAAVTGPGGREVKTGSVPGGRQLTLPVTVNGVQGVAFLDSGARGTVINRGFAKAAGIDPDGPAFKDASTLGASGATAALRSGPIGKVVFAGIERTDLQARVADLPVFAALKWADRPVMILGLDLLRPTRLILDYAARRVWLAHSTCAGASQ